MEGELRPHHCGSPDAPLDIAEAVRASPSHAYCIGRLLAPMCYNFAGANITGWCEGLDSMLKDSQRWDLQLAASEFIVGASAPNEAWTWGARGCLRVLAAQLASHDVSVRWVALAALERAAFVPPGTRYHRANSRLAELEMRPARMAREAEQKEEAEEVEEVDQKEAEQKEEAEEVEAAEAEEEAAG